MTAPKFKADRGSSTGDDLRELWALRRSPAALAVRLDARTAAHFITRV